MKRSRIYLVAVVIIAVLFGWGIWRVYRVLKASMEPSVCLCTLSSTVSDKAAQVLSHLVENSILEKKDSLAAVVRRVQKEFPCCSLIDCRQKPSGLVQARIEFDELLCAVNDATLATAHGALVSKMVYADHELIGLPQVRIPNAQVGESLSPSLLAFLRHISESFFATHEVVYRSDQEIALVSREMPTQPMYLCAVNTVVDNGLLARCDSVLDDYEQQKATNKKKTRTALVLDVRFDKQIILYPYMGGQIHG